jgi:hypothetical protein
MFIHENPRRVRDLADVLHSSHARLRQPSINPFLSGPIMVPEGLGKG